MASAFDIASTMLGKSEVPNHAEIQDYLRTGGANLDPATAAWCAAFVNSSLQQAGLKGTGSNLARSFLNYGTPVQTPEHGDIAVFARGGPNSGLGHVGFVDRLNPDGTVHLLSGNHGNAVGFGDYPTTGLLGYRRPGAAVIGDVVAPTDAAKTPAFNQAASGTVQPTAQPGPNAATVPDPAASFGDVVAPQAAPDFGTLVANYMQRSKQRNEDQQVEATRRQALLSVQNPFV